VREGNTFGPVVITSDAPAPRQSRADVFPCPTLRDGFTLSGRCDGDRALQASRDSHGAVTLTIRVDANGSVSKVQTSSKERTSAELAACIAARFRAFQFAASDGAWSVSTRLMLSSPNGR
jgi:hypothetical protein